MKIEREFLALASTWLACRLRVMGGTVGSPLAGDLAYALLGCVDYAAEMRLVCGEGK